MKKNNFAYVLSLVSIMAIFFISCESDRDNDENMFSNEKIIGLWQNYYSVTDEGEIYYSDGSIYLYIKADGTYTFYDQYTLEPPHIWIANEEGTWQIKNNELYLSTEQYGSVETVLYQIKSLTGDELRFITETYPTMELVCRRANIEDIELFDKNIFIGDWQCIQETYTEYSFDGSYRIEEITYRENMENPFDISFKNDGTFSVLFFDKKTISGGYSITDEGKLLWDIGTENDSWYIFLENRDKLILYFNDNSPISDGIYYSRWYYFDRK